MGGDDRIAANKFRGDRNPLGCNMRALQSEDILSGSVLSSLLRAAPTLGNR